MDFLTCIWLIIDVSCFAIVVGAKFRNVLPGYLQDVMVYGKTRQDDSTKHLHWSRRLLLVPNRWFMHFYALGLLWNIFLLTTFAETIMNSGTSYSDAFGLVRVMTANSETSQLDCFSALLTLSLLTIQLSRRLYESLFVSSFSGKMHLGHYVIGVLFYVLVNLTIVAEIPHSISQGWYESCLKPSYQISWLHFLALSLFIWASYHQYQCHTILGKLSLRTPDGKKIYKIPHGDWFEHVSSPHYLAEILIYIAFFLAMRAESFRWILVMIFVILNLVLGAQNTHLWYEEKFDDYPKRQAILPGVY